MASFLGDREWNMSETLWKVSTLPTTLPTTLPNPTRILQQATIVKSSLVLPPPALTKLSPVLNLP